MDLDFGNLNKKLFQKIQNYEAKMLRIKRLLKKPNCIVLFQDEKKVSIKLHSGYEWRKKRRTIPLNQKVKEVLILFGVYSLHKNFRYFKFYPSNNSYYFVKFIKKIAKNLKIRFI
jgi:hypothetical protein